MVGAQMSVYTTEVETVCTKYQNVIACKVKKSNSILKFTLVNFTLPIEDKTTLFLCDLKFNANNKTCHARIVNPAVQGDGVKRPARPTLFEEDGPAETTALHTHEEP